MTNLTDDIDTDLNYELLKATYQFVEGINMATFKPMPKHLVVRWLRKIESKGGILYPENRQRKNYFKGEILSTGADCHEKLTKGAIVQFDSLADKEFLGPQDPADRDTVFIMREEDVHGVIQGTEGAYEFTPLNEYVLIKPEEGKKSLSGLIVPGSVSNQTSKVWCGNIVAVGPRVTEEAKYRELGITIGERFAYDSFQGNEVILNDRLHVIIRADYLMGEVEDSADIHLVGA